MTMLLTVTEAATVLQCSPRAVRARLARGELRGQKSDGQWRIPRAGLPLTADQHQALAARADEIRGVVEHALSQRQRGSPEPRRNTLADLVPFRAGRTVLVEMRRSPETPGCAQAAELLGHALLVLGRAWPVFHPRARLHLLDEARAEIGAAIAVLLLTDPVPDTAAAWAQALEEHVLPPLAGLCRAAERRGESPRSW